MADPIDRQATESIPHEEYRLIFDHVMHTLDGKVMRIGHPIQCKVYVSTAWDKRMGIEKLFEKMHEAVMWEEQDV